MTATPRTLEVNEGEQAEFNCVATGDSAPFLEWSRSRQVPHPPSPSSSHHLDWSTDIVVIMVFKALPVGASQVGNRLLFARALPEHTGDYSCRGGEAEATVRLTVQPRA